MVRKPKKIIESSGVYIFRRRNTPLYIGKAANLKKRLGSYFANAERLTPKVKRMLEEADRLETIETASEIEALLKEAKLIKRYRPKYNALMRDDKSYFYVGITQEEFPRISITHQPRQETRNPKPPPDFAWTKSRRAGETRNKSKIPSPKYIGPFTSGTALKETLRLLRRVFPYCTCKRPHKRPCLNSQIGRCPGYCCTIPQIYETGSRKIYETGSRRYRKNIRNIVAMLTGRKTRLIAKLKSEMREAVRRERYEQAARLRDQIFGLEDVFQHRTVLQEPGIRYSWTALESMLRAMLRTDCPIERIEGYDVSNISGREATGSMVAFTNGEPDKSQYRKFRIKTVRGISDVDMLKEVLQRRFKHSEWPYPDLMVIDGGKPQLNAALKTLQGSGIRGQGLARRNDKKLSPIPYTLSPPLVAALAKREEILFLENGRSIALKRQEPVILHLFQRIRDESHRFARVYHHKLRQKQFAASTKP